MNTTRDSAYCRLCAELKQHNQLKNLQTDEELWKEVVDKLSRFNIEMDFRETILPKSVCLICVKSLERAFAFVTAVEQAQTFLSDVILVQNTSYKPPEYRKSTNVLKHEINDGGTILRDILVMNSDSTTKRNIIAHDIENEHDIQSIHEISVENTVTRKRCGSQLMTDLYNDRSTINRNDTEHEIEKNHDIQPINEIMVDNTITSNKFDSQVMTDVHSKHSMIERNINKHDNIETKHNIQPPNEITVMKTIDMTWKDYEWKCSHCGTLFPNIEELQKHSMQYHNVCNPYQCTECEHRRSNLTEFIKHVRRKHNNDLLYSCYKCFKKFNNPHESGKHKRIIHEDSNYVCLGCNTPFYNERELTEHVNKYYNKCLTKTPNDLKCKICEKVTASAKDFRAHFRVHRDKKVLVCETCGKCYSCKRLLAEHMGSHSQDGAGKNLHRCDVCDCTFVRAASLRIHKTIHTGIRAFTCDICGKSYRTKNYIANHMATHMYPFSKACTVCHKKLSSATILRNHMRQHTGEKPFSCTICKRDFADLCNRNKHMRRRHGIEMAKKRLKLGMPPVETPPSSGVVENNLVEDKNKSRKRK